MCSDITTINPATDEEIASYSFTPATEVPGAIQACQDAFVRWREVSLEDRAKVISAIGKELLASQEEFAALMTREVGKLIGDSHAEIELCAQICQFTAEHGPKELADEEKEIPSGTGIVHYAPIGIVYGIQPWNFPCYQAIRYSIASLMAGNGVLLKHAANCTGSALYLRDVFERAGLPKNLFTVLVIDHDQSDKVIENAHVRGVTFTGSDDAGRVVAQKAASVLKKTVLELGSNDAYVVLDDADIDLAAETCVAGRMYNNGQACVNAKRFVVTEKNYDAFVESCVARMDAIEMGDPTDDATKLGPMARSDLRDKLAKQVGDSVSKGARAADPSGFSADPFTDVIRDGARKLIEQAIHAELATLMAAFSNEKLEDGRARLVRHGHLPERDVMTGIGPVPVKVPRVRDRGSVEDKITFTPSILPRYLRKAKSIEERLPWLYLKGVSTGDFTEALEALLGPNAKGLSAKTITRLKADWWKDYEAWEKRDLSARRFLYIWADGVYFKPRMAEEKQCVLVIVGADEYGRKELLAVTDGFRESSQSWREVLLDLKRRGLKQDPKLAVGDGALGFWSALREVFATTREQRCWVHKTMNVLNAMPKSVQAKAKGHLHDISLS